MKTLFKPKKPDVSDGVLRLVPVTTDGQVEWLRVQRSRPEVFKYFRQDKPITEDQQKKWWKNIDKTTIKLYIIVLDDTPIGYVGFNPINRRANTAEFGLFIVPEHQGYTYGAQALRALLLIGFEDCHLSNIYSDVLDYPGENRFEFYKKLGFEAFPKEHQILRYPKQGKMVPSIKFFMTRDMWRCHGVCLDEAKNG